MYHRLPVLSATGGAEVVVAEDGAEESGAIARSLPTEEDHGRKREICKYASFDPSPFITEARGPALSTFSPSDRFAKRDETRRDE